MPVEVFSQHRLQLESFKKEGGQNKVRMSCLNF